MYWPAGGTAELSGASDRHAWPGAAFPTPRVDQFGIITAEIVMDLEARIARLERQNKRLGRLATGLLAVVGVGLLTGGVDRADVPVQDEVRARKFVVVDRDNRVTAEFNDAELRFNDRNGQLRASHSGAVVEFHARSGGVLQRGVLDERSLVFMKNEEVLFNLVDGKILKQQQ